MFSQDMDFLWAGVWLISLLWNDSGKASRHNLRSSLEKILQVVETIEAPATPAEDDLDSKKNFET